MSRSLLTISTCSPKKGKTILGIQPLASLELVRKNSLCEELCFKEVTKKGQDCLRMYVVDSDNAIADISTRLCARTGWH